MKKNGNYEIRFQLYQFEWIVIEEDYPIQIRQFASKITETEFTNLNGFQWFTIQYVKWFRFIASLHRFTPTIFPFILIDLSEWIVSNFDGLQSIQSSNLKYLHGSETIIPNYNWFNVDELNRIKNCIFDIMKWVVWNNDRSNWRINGFNEIGICNFGIEKLIEIWMNIYLLKLYVKFSTIYKGIAHIVEWLR